MSRKSVRKIIIILIIIVALLLIAQKLELPNRILTLIYPKNYASYVQEYAKKYEVDENLIYAIIKAESNFKASAVSNKGAKGLMQLMDSTAEDMAKKMNVALQEDDILIPDVNIQIGTKYIAGLLEKYENIELALTAYNAGSGKVDKWIEEGRLKKDGSDVENIPYKETNNYVRKIMRDYKIYEKLYA